ncbi:N-6 DNA methylase [Gelidibacter japonicus]|uniref:class I SAM-dependent DNA methyltransferase n=1 Tax=Gelidibacter japonicus TaxID=1962232 RepID=UPI003A8E53C2
MSNIAGIIKSIRDIFRKDPGLSGDAQRIEQLGWMIFLKLFDDKDKEKEILNHKYKSPIPTKLQWRNWAEDDEGMTGDALITFVNNELFPQLKNLTIGLDDKLGVIIRNIFDGTNNYMKSGTTFRQAINKLNEIDFNSSKEHHIFNAIYEDILQGLATKKDTGEFYTPRAVTQFIVDMVNPKLGEKISDPACGTAGFLVCAIEHLRKQVKNIDNRKTLQETITGTELKPLPFMLSVVNLITHDIEVPQIVNTDALSREYTSIKQADRVDIIIANPPFGGVVGDGMETNFPLNYRTKESADLFLILFIQMLKDGGRAGIVLPDGSLTGDGVKQRIRQKLLEDCNVQSSVLKSFREKARFLFNETERTLSFFHNSFKQFLLHHTSLNYLTGEYDPTGNIKYHIQLADYYVKSEIEKSWKQNHHLFQAKQFERFVSVVTPDSFTEQLLNFRPAEEIKQDAKLGVEIARQNRDINTLVRYLFSLTEIERRLFNIDPASFTEELLFLTKSLWTKVP